jgi:glycosyltransferase involved in cell wall biosynthesis
LSKKIKILTLSDHPLSPSGVGTQTKYVCEALLNTGRFSILSFGGAMKHQDYNPIQVDPYGEDWKIIPTDGYGTPEMIRGVLQSEKPDMIWFMTDPRFFGWLWQMENEIRPLVPMIYYHVWDNKPYPMFNRNSYLSNDFIATISKVTDDVVKNVSPEVNRKYIPHAVDSKIFRPLTDKEIEHIRTVSLLERDREKVIFFWNNRNARRKQSGTLVFWFKDFLDKYDLHDKAQLIMHTDPKDVHGQDLEHIIHHLGLTNGQVLFSTNKVKPEELSGMYNMVDCTINISDAEGFGLGTLESLSCGTPIIVNMTGGLKEQITDGKDFFGVPLMPSSKAIIGSQSVPYIYEDRLNKDQFVAALHKIYSLTNSQRREIGMLGRKHVETNYNFENFSKTWVDVITEIYEREGSWENRKNYNGIRFMEVA